MWEVARQAGASQLVLTHLQPDTKKERLLNDANKEFTRPNGDGPDAAGCLGTLVSSNVRRKIDIFQLLLD